MAKTLPFILDFDMEIQCEKTASNLCISHEWRTTATLNDNSTQTKMMRDFVVIVIVLHLRTNYYLIKQKFSFALLMSCLGAEFAYKLHVNCSMKIMEI